jgi:hypothetical protein
MLNGTRIPASLFLALRAAISCPTGHFNLLNFTPTTLEGASYGRISQFRGPRHPGQFLFFKEGADCVDQAKLPQFTGNKSPGDIRFKKWNNTCSSSNFSSAFL